MGQLTTLEQDA